MRFVIPKSGITWPSNRSTSREFDVTPMCLDSGHCGAHLPSQLPHRPIPLPSREILEGSLLAYHGGKNNLACKPGWYRDVACLDLSSAYPKAMHEFHHSPMRRLIEASVKRGARMVPIWGISHPRESQSLCVAHSIFALV